MASEAEVLPPSTSTGVAGWLRANLFSSMFNSVLTVIVGSLTIVALAGAFQWVVFTADWSPVTESLKLFLVGQYPSEELWRVGVAVVAATTLMGEKPQASVASASAFVFDTIRPQ